MEMELESSRPPFYEKTPEGSEAGESTPLVKPKQPYPISIFFIIANEFCERFSYFGMRAILTLYLRNILLYNEDGATIVYHTFIMICYITPFLGAYISDAHIGKFKTIFYFSIIHAMGNVILSIASFKNPPIHAVVFSLVGLALTSIGTGGIKPCVSAFGGDQFKIPGQEKQLQQYFFVFYFSINLGSLISEFITPILRRDVSCQGEDTCYPLAFGVPAILMLVALVIFVLGKPLYVIKEPTENIVVDIWRCVKYAICQNLKKEKDAKSENEHWLDNARDKFEPQLVDDVKRLFSIIILFSPLPIFWALYEQQGSRWTFQASRMNGYITDDFTIKPDQMQVRLEAVVNSVLCLCLIPVFDLIVYPLCEKCNLLVNPLKRLSLGAFLVAISFIIAGVLELKMESTYAVIPESMESNVNFINTLPCPVNISLEKSIGDDMDDGLTDKIHTLNPYENYAYEKLRSWKYQVNLSPAQNICAINGVPVIFHPLDIDLYSTEATSVLIKKTPTNEVSLLLDTGYDSLSKSPESNSKIRIIFDQSSSPLQQTILLESSSNNKNYTIKILAGTSSSKAKEIQPRIYSVYLTNEPDLVPRPLGNISVDQGGSYLIGIFPNYNSTMSNEDKVMRQYMLTQPNTVHMFWIIPQFVVITIGELLFAITGFDFSYCEAPTSMKAVIQSCWLCTIALGNVIVIVVTMTSIFTRDATQFFTFAVFMLIGDLIFMALAANYKVRSPRWKLGATASENNENDE